MIQKIDSGTMTSLLQRAEQTAKAMETSMYEMAGDLANKLKVIQNEQEYAEQRLLELTELLNGAEGDYKNKIVFPTCGDMYGVYDVFGCSVHPAFLGKPDNIFNFEMSVGAMFKNNMNVKLNGEISELYKHALMHDTIAEKGVAFTENDEPQIRLEIEVNPGDLLGSTAFNTIELAPYLPGSLQIDEIEIYDMSGRMAQSTSPDFQLAAPIAPVGNERILLPRRYNLFRVVLLFRCRFRNLRGKYPFGLRHLYFLNAEYDPNSYVVAKLTRDRPFDWIGDELVVRDQSGRRDSSCTVERVQLYMNWKNGAPEYEIPTTKGAIPNVIARNLQELYVRVPLDRSWISLAFKKVGER